VLKQLFLFAVFIEQTDREWLFFTLFYICTGIGWRAYRSCFLSFCVILSNDKPKMQPVFRACPGLEFK
jgi:hypothetical protein